VRVRDIVVVGSSGLESESDVVEDTVARARDDSVRMNVRSDAMDWTGILELDTGRLAVIEAETLPELLTTLPLGNATVEDCEENTELGG
jgi:hypothetical protein